MTKTTYVCIPHQRPPFVCDAAEHPPIVADGDQHVDGDHDMHATIPLDDAAEWDGHQKYTVRAIASLIARGLILRRADGG